MATLESLVAESRDTDPWRPAALAAGPAGVLTIVAFVASIVLARGDELAMATSEVAIASSVIGLACLALLVLGMFSLAGSVAALRRGVGLLGWTIACVGTLLGAGGQWALLFVVPGLAGPAPELAINGIGTVTAGYIVSFVSMAVGWLIVGVVLLRSGAPKPGSWLVVVGALLCVAPLPARFFMLAIAMSVLARSLRRAPAAGG